MLKLSLYDYSDSCIFASGTIKIMEQEQMIMKNDEIKEIME